MLTAGLLCLFAYLVGSIPSGYLLVRAVRKVDVRHFGSRSIGAINVCHVGGACLGVITLAADVGKALGVVLLAGIAGASPWVVAATGLLAMAGHAYSVWLFLAERRFSEGKSVACGLGVIVGLSLLGEVPWHVAVVPVGVWLCGLAGPRLLTGRWSFISPATMTAAVSLPLAAALGQARTPYLCLSAAMAALILLRHRNNLRRLLAGTEPRLDDRLAREPLLPAAEDRIPASEPKVGPVPRTTNNDRARRWSHHESGRHTSRRWTHLGSVRS